MNETTLLIQYYAEVCFSGKVVTWIDGTTDFTLIYLTHEEYKKAYLEQYANWFKWLKAQIPQDASIVVKSFTCVHSFTSPIH